MWLILAHPEIASRSCLDCARWLYNEDGSPTERPAGSGQRVPRPPGMPTPCHSCPKIPTGAYPAAENARELTPRLCKTYLHYRRCKAVGRFPVQPHGEDDLMVANAAIIADVVQLWESQRFQRMELAMLSSATASLAGKTGGG